MTWKKSTFCSAGACVEVAWERSSFCGNATCVEVAGDGDRVLLRDGKLGDASPVISFSPAEWASFLELAAGVPVPLRS